VHKPCLIPLGLRADQVKWSQLLKTENIQINHNKVKMNKNNYNNHWNFVLLDEGFSSTVKQKQCWAIKIIKDNYSNIYVGVCLRNEVQKWKFDKSNLK